MRYHEFARPEPPLTRANPRMTLSLYVVDGEYADCAAMIRRFRCEIVGVTKVPVGGMTLQVRCLSVDVAYELFASWLDCTSKGPRRPRVAPVA